jgi:hypothetical protein
MVPLHPLLADRIGWRANQNSFRQQSAMTEVGTGFLPLAVGFDTVVIIILRRQIGRPSRWFW